MPAKPASNTSLSELAGDITSGAVASKGRSRLDRGKSLTELLGGP